MTKDEALRLALEALEGVLDDSPKVLDASISGGLYEVVQCRDAITAIKAALEAKDEPLAYLQPTASPENVCYNPSQRTWVGLTADEYAELAEEYGPFPINQIEAKLKQKNCNA